MISHFLKAVQRPWHLRERSRYPLHLAVRNALDAVSPQDWHLVLLEWPHVSEDQTRLAYTRSEDHGIQNRQTVTSIQKYLTRHWPQLKSHEIAKFAASYSPDVMKFLDTTPEIITALYQGPASCMTDNFEDFQEKLEAWQSEDDEEPDWDEHPYATYDPKLGWRMAVRQQLGRTVARALVYGKAWVRSYGPEKCDGRTMPDNQLERWMEQQGLQQASSWPQGTKLRHIDTGGEGPLAPYIDGGEQNVEIRGAHLVIDSDGDYECNNVDGTADYDDDCIGHCEDCGRRIHDGDEYIHSGRDADHLTCCTEDYTHVRGESNSRLGYRSYYVEDYQAADVWNQSYSVDRENLPDSVVQLEDCDYAELDDTVEIDDEYYLECDGRIVWLSDEEVHALKDDCWEDSEGEWHSDSVEKVELDGDFYTREQADEIIHNRQLALELGA